jgi:membrane protein
MSLQDHPLLRRLPLQEARDMLRFARRRLDEERLPQVAASLTFTTMLALVPLLTIALAVFTAFPVFNTFRASLEAYFIKSLMPQMISSTILGYLNQFAAKATRLSAIGAVFLVLTSVAMMLTIDRAFNHIWRVRESRPLTQRIVIYWAIVTLGPLLIGVSITMTSYLFTATSGLLSAVAFTGVLLSTTISVLLTTAAFTLLYMAVPNRLVDWRDAAWGGFLAAAVFEIAKRSFVDFITQFPTYTKIYGALAALPIFLVWVYLSWLIALIGAVLAAALPVVRYERWWHTPTPGSEFVDAMAVLKVLYEARTSSPRSAVDTGTIRATTRLGFDESESLLQRMLDVGWVGRIKDPQLKRVQFGKRINSGRDSWTLLGNPAQLRLADVYRLFVFLPVTDLGPSAVVAEAVEQGLDQTLADYFSGNIRKMPVRSSSASTSPSHP